MMNQEKLMQNIRGKIAQEQLEPLNQAQVESYERLSLVELWLYYLMSHNQNLSVFISGIISSIPMTLLLNLVGVDLKVIPHAPWYLAVYIVVLAASAVFCFQSWGMALDHIKVDECRQKNNDLNLREKDIYYLFKEFDIIRKHLVCSAKRLFISGSVTVLGVIGVFIIINL